LEMQDLSKMLQEKFLMAEETQEFERQKYFVFFSKLVGYIHTSISTETYEDAKFLIEILAHFIDLAEDKSHFKGDSTKEKEQVQLKLNQVGAVQMVLELMCYEQSEVIDELFPTLLYFANKILDGAENEI